LEQSVLVGELSSSIPCQYILQCIYSLFVVYLTTLPIAC
jgi:hypothetical protein